MKTLTQLLQRTAALAIFVFTLQLVVRRLESSSLKLMAVFHTSALNPIFRLATKLFSFAVLNLIIATFFVHNYVVRPRFVRNVDFAMFFCLTLSMGSFFGALFGELRPYIQAVLTGNKEISIYDCEMGFGMPADHLFIVGAVYYMYRVRYFEERKSIDEDPSDPSNYAEYDDDVNGRMRAHKSVFKRSGPMELPYMQFTIVSWMYIAGTIVCRYIAASSFITQSVLSVSLSLLWSHVYFTYLSKPLQYLIYNLFVSSSDAAKPLRFVNRSIVGLLIVQLVLSATRSFFFNAKDAQKLSKQLAASCNPYFRFTMYDIYNSLYVIIPLLMINLFASVTDPGQYDIPVEGTYFDLHRGDKAIRAGLFITPLIAVYMLKWGFDYVLFELTGSRKYGGLHFMFHVMCCTALAYYYAIVLPSVMLKNGILIKGDIPFSSNRESIAFKKDVARAEDSNDLEDNTDARDDKTDTNREGNSNGEADSKRHKNNTNQ